MAVATGRNAMLLLATVQGSESVKLICAGLGVSSLV